MAGQFPAPPTYAEVVIVDEVTKRSQFNPIWLKFFLDIVAALNGTGGGGVIHNNLAGLQGGTSNQYYHLTLAQFGGLLTATEKAALTGGTTTDASAYHNHRNQAAISNITVGASPYVHQNTSNYDSCIIIQGGTVSLVEYTRDNTNFFNIGVVAGFIHLSPNDRLRVTYTVVPTMRYIQS